MQRRRRRRHERPRRGFHQALMRFIFNVRKTFFEPFSVVIRLLSLGLVALEEVPEEIHSMIHFFPEVP